MSPFNAAYPQPIQRRLFTCIRIEAGIRQTECPVTPALTPQPNTTKQIRPRKTIDQSLIQRIRALQRHIFPLKSCRIPGI